MKCCFAEMRKMAGCTKQGKSVAMNAMIASLMLLKGQEEVSFR